MKNITEITNLFFQEHANMFWYLVSIYYPFSNTVMQKKGIVVMLLFIVNYFLNLQKHNSF